MSSESFQAPSLEYLGQHLPQYDFEAFIAQGGMGAVYKARQISLDRTVAIKVLPHELGENQEFRESFAKEAKAMAKVNHPNLIGVFDSGDVDGMPYIVMEYIEGSSLHDACYGQVVDSAQTVAIVKGICDGLADAHEHGIIHRDIKPANILLTAKAEPKIGDFGLAHPSDSDESGLVMGTPGYTAPEIFIDPDQAGVLADQYSVGMILHQLLTGIDPAGTQGPPTVPSGNIRLDAIWRKATQINPADRYPSVAAMAADLQKWVDSKSGKSVAGRALHAGVPRIAPATLAATKSNSGGGALVKILVVAILCAAAWYGYKLSKGQPDSRPPEIADSGAPEVPPSLNPVDPPKPRNPENPSGRREENPDHHAGTDPRPHRPSHPERQDVATTNPPRHDPVVPRPHDPVPDVRPPSKPQLPPGDPQLQEKAIALILDARKKRDALLGKNTKAFQQVLDSQAAIVRDSEARSYEELRRKCDSGRVPAPEDMPDLNEKVSLAYKNTHREQLAIESKYTTELTRIRDFYVPILEKAAAATSNEELKSRLLAQAKLARDLDHWVATLVPEPERSSTAAAILTEEDDHTHIVINNPVAGGRGFAGHWDVVTDDRTQWITDADGGVTISSGQWKGKTATWEMLEDGSVEVHWPDKPRPYRLTRNGNGWSGVTSFDQPVTLTLAN